MDGDPATTLQDMASTEAREMLSLVRRSMMACPGPLDGKRLRTIGVLAPQLPCMQMCFISYLWHDLL